MAETNWNYFDARCTLGRYVKMQGTGPCSADDLLTEMDHYGIAEALVVDSLSRENHPAEGNRRTVESTAGEPRLHPAWAALPPGTDEQPPPDELVERMRAERVGALFLFTGQYRIPLSDWAIDDLLGPLSEARVPLFLCPNEFGPGPSGQDKTDWEALVDLCRRWPDLPVVVTEFRIRRTQRALYRALDACPNLRIELSGYWLYRAVEYITERWGAHRLIFGSNWPIFGPHMTLATLACAEIEDEDKLRIAGGNLRELLDWCEPVHPDVEPAEPTDEYVEFGRTGRRPEQIRFHDCHGHLGGFAAHYHVPDGDLDSTVREMDRLGVQRTCVFSFSGVFGDERPGNDTVADAVRRYPDRFIGFTLLNPHRGRDEMLRELERCSKMGLRGIKLIPYYQGYPQEGALLEVPCQWAHERRQIILNHSWGAADHLAGLLEKFPDACYINGHMTAAYADLMRRHDNLYICSCPLIPPRACEEAVEAFGADRLLFGSDLQDLPIAWGLGPIAFARIPVEQKRRILGGNLCAILERYSLSP